MSNTSKKVIHFTPGPTKLPERVLKDAQNELISWQGTGKSILELSHRSSEFSKIKNGAELKIRSVLDVPDNYKILFLQGGATGQFAAVAMNLIARNSNKAADYIVTGSWSAKAVGEAKKYGLANEVFPRMKQFTNIPNKDNWNLNPNASYLYYCANETIHGMEMLTIPEPPQGVPLVCDMSSFLLSCPLDVTKYGLIFASAQKNLGCAGVTLVIVRDDLLEYGLPETPSFLSYQLQSNMSSVYNTPPTFGIYLMDLMFNWVADDQGGLAALSARNYHKAKVLYDFIDESNGFYICPVHENLRSRINIVMRIKHGDEKLENELVKYAQSKHYIEEISGHRSVGGLRISIYNAIELDEVKALITCLAEFKTIHD